MGFRILQSSSDRWSGGQNFMNRVTNWQNAVSLSFTSSAYGKSLGGNDQHSAIICMASSCLFPAVARCSLDRGRGISIDKTSFWNSPAAFRMMKLKVDGGGSIAFQELWDFKTPYRFNTLCTGTVFRWYHGLISWKLIKMASSACRCLWAFQLSSCSQFS